MIVERLYTRKAAVELPLHSLGDDRSFSEVEENACGWLCYKEINI